MIWLLVIDAGAIVRKPLDDSGQSSLSRQQQATFYQSDGDHFKRHVTAFGNAGRPFMNR